MVSLADRLAFFFPSSRIKSPAVFQLQPKYEVTGFAGFSQLLLGNANADADSSTGFLCGKKNTTLSQALFQKLCGRRDPLFLQKSLTGVLEWSDTTQPWSPYEKQTFLISEYCLHKYHHIVFYFQPGQGSESHQSFALPIYFWLLGVFRLLSSSGLHYLRAPQASPATL